MLSQIDTIDFDKFYLDLFMMPKEVLEYLNTQRVGVLAVEMLDGSPHAATVHFAYDENSGLFLFETDKRYRKSEPLFAKELIRASFVIGFEETNTKTLQLDGVAQLVKTETEKELFEKVYYGKFSEKVEKAKKLGANWVSFSFKPNWWRFTVWTEDKGKAIISSENIK